MEIESLFLDSKWNILTELSHSSLSPTELAIKTKTSIANISAQLRLLEALDFIEKEKLGNIMKGQPRRLYSLKKDFAYLVLGSKSVIGKKLLKLDNEAMPFFSVWLINDSTAPYVLIKFFLDNEQLLKDASSLGYLGIRGDELEVIIIHPIPANLQVLQEKQVVKNDKVYKIRAHVHSKDDIETGISKKDEYFTSILRKVFIVFDRDNTLSKLKKGGK